VLEGPEGRGKSSAIEILAGAENFSDQTILTLDDKAQQEAIGGVWLYEIADLAGMSKADTEKVKAFCSRTIDRARPAYGRHRLDKPRRCIFIATTNHETFLKSQTGNRRFWPVRTGRIDLAGLARDCDQLWAEAARIEARGVSLALPEGLWREAAEVQDARREADPWDDILEHVPGKQHGDEMRISTYELMHAHLGVATERMTDFMGKRLSYTMRRLGWQGPMTLWINQKSTRGYRRTLTHKTSKDV
jgi:predicted P-loop ATPase